MSKIIVISSHPDDEAFGLGGTLYLHKKNGDKILVLIFTDGESARNVSKTKILRRRKQAKAACSILGVNEVKFLNYPDQMLDTYPLVKLSKDIEKVLKSWNADTVYTHFWGDVNQDHRKVFEATMIACRPIPKSKIRRLLCYESPSSTEWNFAEPRFAPNLFVDIKNGIKKKMQAVQVYKEELRETPHPRSLESIKNRARYWGSTVGVEYAEAFIIIRQTNLES